METLPKTLASTFAASLVFVFVSCQISSLIADKENLNERKESSGFNGSKSWH